jgi:hypothetical protein
MIHDNRRRSSPAAATALGIALAIGSVSFAPVALAGDSEGDAVIELYALHRQECARQPDLPACMGFGAASGAGVASRAVANPSRAAVPARLGRGRHPAGR